MGLVVLTAFDFRDMKLGWFESECKFETKCLTACSEVILQTSQEPHNSSLFFFECVCDVTEVRALSWPRLHYYVFVIR